MREFAQRVTAERRAESSIDAVNELRPHRNPLVLLKAVIPLAGGGLQIERCRLHLKMIRRAVGAEELLSLVQPCDGVIGTVELREPELVRRRGRGFAGGGRTIGVETALAVQDLRLDILDGSQEKAGLLAERCHVIVHLLAIVADHLDESVDHFIQDCLRDRNVGVMNADGIKRREG